MASRLDIHDVNYIAGIRGGKCLSKEYVNNVSPLKWMCEKGHTWDASYRVIQQGGWCVQCIREDDKIRWLIKLQKLAESRKGKCLSAKYESMHTHLKWQCEKGHIWMAIPVNIQSGRWCKICSIKKVGEDKRMTVPQLKALAQSHDGKFLSGTYITNHSILKWQCKKGHTWLGSTHSVKRGQWCPICAGKIIHTIKEMKLLAQKKDGKCLSIRYINSYTKLKWQCNKGHIWEAKPTNILRGSWCHVCAKAPKYTILDMQIIARRRGGKCLSAVYKSSEGKLKWQCKYGHKWEGRISDVLHKNSWCSACAKGPKYTIADMQAIARKRKGKCLSTVYKSTDGVLKWQCQYGHKWEARAHAMLYNNSWCRICARKKRKGKTG